jgi:N-carbamoylputrescine amidase
MKDLKIAAVCMHSEPKEVEQNLERMAFYIAEASKAKADIICFPELAIPGYLLNNPKDIYDHARSQDIIQRVTQMARAGELLIIAGTIEMPERGKPFIAQIVAGPDGLIGFYRKTHLSPPEKVKYQAGDIIDVFTYRDTSFGIQLCYEAHFPEISTIQAIKGADIIFMPHASPRGTPEGKVQSWSRHLPSRAFDNALFVVACNQVGQSSEGFFFPGVIVVFDPAGKMISNYRGNGEKMILAEVKKSDLNHVRRHKMRYFLPNRRPDLYHDIVSK